MAPGGSRRNGKTQRQNREVRSAQFPNLHSSQIKKVKHFRRYHEAISKYIKEIELQILP